jgi:TorA maturation chaperone TorD
VSRAVARTVLLQPALADEDAARADWYALLAHLFLAPPDATLLARLAGADPGASDDSPLGRAFRDLARASAQADPQAIRAEYDSAFVGVGKPEVFLQASYYLAGFLHERPLAELRQALAQLGIGRRDDASETEDHVGLLCEAMRFLIRGDGGAPGALEAQRDLFGRFVAPWFESLCDAIEHSGSTDYYKHVGRLARAFFAVERQAFDFDS